MRIRYILIVLLLSVAAYMTHTPRTLLEPEARDLSTFPRQIGQWASVSDVIFNEPTLKVLRPTDYLMRTYVNPDGCRLGLYIGYHNGGKASGPVHSPKNCLPGAGWYMAESQEMRVNEGENEIRLVRADFRMQNQKMICYYWYQVCGTIVTTDISMKFFEFTGVLFKNRKDASFIRIDVMDMEHKKSDALAKDFLKDAYPLMVQYLPSSN
ncbi:EpsI family protein [Desulfosarcina sp. OttesenSCG-928-G10]|nr:EpsI family protein [Desulfosarcina sp. OttesenSCG-928-G10]MDL2321198.1 EpsI family protein [Desulfosarcina sp. OttesenSCG-928-B08]